MRISGLAVVLATVIPVAPALAQQDLITGVYTRSVEQCAAAKKDFDAFTETGEMVMTADGMWAVEFNCQFVDWKPRQLGPGAVVIALCEEPGYAYPEVYAVMPRGEGELEFTLPLAAQQGDQPGNYGMWYLCEGVTMPGG